MKPHEETWKSVGRFLAKEDGTSMPHKIGELGYTTSRDDVARAALASCAPEMARLLLDATTKLHAPCIWCHPSNYWGHTDSCPAMAVLVKAGVRSLSETRACKCGRSEGADPHSCPYRAEIYDDYDTRCNCCEACAHECAMDI